MFRSPLDVRAHEPGEFALLAPLAYELVEGIEIIVPANFITDFASIPRPIQILPSFGVNGRSRRAAVLHDYLYAAQGRVTLHILKRHSETPVSFNRQECDSLFREALVKCGVRRLAAQIMYLGVRIGGAFYWGIIYLTPIAKSAGYE